jgi:serine/threonine-protein kinase
MHPGLGDDQEFADRFVREARAAARLSHPHVVGVYDQGDDGGTLFLAMEYVPGRTLRDLIRSEAPMAPGRALALLDPVLSALAAAHHAGLIHRDVKPENVLVADDGRVKVADFGLARAISAETQHTATGGVLIGTVSYLSPELVVDGRADARSDVYAVGVVLHEMLTGRKPHEGDSPIQVAYKHVHEDVPPPSRLAPGLPAYVDALVARATARDRDLRPADARVLLHQVRRVRAALDHGVLDDPDLVADLVPTTPVERLDDIDYVREDPPTILSPAQAVAAARAEDTSVIAGHRPSGSTRAPVTRPRRRSRGGPLLLLLVLLLAVGAGTAGWWYGSGRYVGTPGVVALPAAAAEAKVEAAGLSFDVAGRTFSETVPPGSVVSTDPAGGENVARDGTVSVLLSRGPERHGVPPLRGRTLDRAQQALQAATLSFGEATYRYSDTMEKGVVLGADPEPGTRLRRDAAVDLVVSRGPRPIKVPHLLGQDADTARAVLRKRGLDVEVTEENSDTVDSGDVVAQTPKGGTLQRGDTVELVVSLGPVLVEVPDVRRMGTEAATAALREAGFEVEKRRMPYYVSLEYVVNQDPGSGDRAPRGSTVVIYVV